MRKQAKKTVTDETYPCFEHCLDAEGRTTNLEERRRRRCTYLGFPESRWLPPSTTGYRRHMGLLKVLPSDLPHPPEPYDDGCPGGWYRCAFILSLHKYHRLLTDNGFSDNLLLSRCEDRLVLEAIAHYEQERLRAKARDQEILHSD